MTKLLDRYVSRQFLGTFVLLVLGLPFLFLIVDITEKLETLLDKGLSFWEVALSYVYQLPLFIFWAFPIAALVATVFTIGNLTRHQEIAAAKAGGISFYRLLRPVIVLATLLSVVALGLGELVPLTNRLRAQLLGDAPVHSGMLRTNFVFQTEGGRVLSVRRLDPSQQEMIDVVFEREATAAVPGLHGTASRATWSGKTGWVLENGFLRVLPADGTETTFAFERLRDRGLRETPEDLLAEPRDPEEMGYREMTRFVETIRRSGGEPRELEVEREQKIALPLAVLVIVLFGAPLATSSRRGGAAYGIGISLAVTMIYLLLFRVGLAMGASGTVTPMVAAWMPNVVFLLAGLVLLWRVRT
jgi:lipopolysaccharide export system permease protein